MSNLPGAEDPRLFDFWTQLLRDAERGPLPALQHYLGRFPGLEVEVEREYREAALRATPTNGERADESATPSSNANATRLLFERLRRHPPRPKRYDIEGEIGRGGMGIVHQAFDDDLRRSIAMKVARRSNERATASFLDEAQITGQLDHPGIVPVHELGIDESGAPFFTMKLVKGRTLADVFQLVEAGDKEWTATRALNALLRVCEAMAYAHSKGVIHRDLKPTNVMCGEFGEVYVMDWGLARVVGNGSDVPHASAAQPAARVRTTREDELESTPDSPLATRQGDVVGTPHYMPPEQAAGEREHLSARSDVYSAGAILYQLLAGRAPYTSADQPKTHVAVLMLVIAGPPPALDSLRSGIQAELVAICQKAMARDPAERYPDMSAMAADLRAYLEQRVVSAYRVGAWQEFKKWCARNRLTASIAGFAVLLALGTVFALQETRVSHAVATATHKTAGVQIEPGARASVMRSYLEDQRALETLSTSLAAAASGATSPDLRSRAQKFEQEARNWNSAPMMLRKNALNACLPNAKTWESHFTGAAEADTALQWVSLVEPLAAVAPESWSNCLALARWRSARATRARIDAEGAPFPNEESRDDYDRIVAFVARLAEFCDRDPRIGVTALFQPDFEQAQTNELVALGTDPRSGLLEFAHTRTGSVPRRLPDGRLDVNEHSAMVFVLVPAARTPSEHAAYYIAKQELTLGQWWRAGNLPSVEGLRVWQRLTSEQRRLALMQPVVGVTWCEAALTLRRVGLRIAGESEWERAAVIDTLAARTKIDAAAAILPLDGAFALCVSARAAGGENSLGIFGLEQSPAEWVNDPWLVPEAEPDGNATAPGAKLRVIRGFASPGDESQTALHLRTAATLDERYPLLGIRAVHPNSH